MFLSLTKCPVSLFHSKPIPIHPTQRSQIKKYKLFINNNKKKTKSSDFMLVLILVGSDIF